MKQDNGILVGTSELLLNGLKISSELKSEYIEKYESEVGIMAHINCKLLGYYSIEPKDGEEKLVALPELREFHKKLEILNFTIVDRKSGDLLHKGECVVSKIKISYPDNDKSVITIKLSVSK